MRHQGSVLGKRRVEFKDLIDSVVSEVAAIEAWRDEEMIVAMSLADATPGYIGA